MSFCSQAIVLSCHSVICSLSLPSLFLRSPPLSFPPSSLPPCFQTMLCIEALFPEARLLVCQASRLTYLVPLSVSLSSCFDILEKNKQEAGILSYTVAQSSWHQMFTCTCVCACVLCSHHSGRNRRNVDQLWISGRLKRRERNIYSRL